MKTLIQEFNYLKNTFGSYNVNIIFSSLTGYKDVRSYNTFNEVKNEVKNLLIE